MGTRAKKETKEKTRFTEEAVLLKPSGKIEAWRTNVGSECYIGEESIRKRSGFPFSSAAARSVLYSD